MDTLAMLITTAPLIVPIVVSLGFDPLWFGVVLIVLCEMGQITRRQPSLRFILRIRNRMLFRWLLPRRLRADTRPASTTYWPSD
ncbi:TRAP transporter permease [Pseudomonas shirazensis]|uniref:TRAP transporter permease n=1 Tax=Pseudomonas shirazensis TaxID=2745494 RepID=A0ABU8ZTE0_9PSED|nr:TRAP transporter permease [Pseudomonas putida]